MAEERFKNWKTPKIEDRKLHPEYNFLVHHKDKLQLGENTDIGAFTYINAKHGVVIEKNVQIGSHCSIYTVSTIDDKEYVDFLPYTVKGYVLTGSAYTNTVYHYDGLVETSPGVYQYDARAEGVFVNVDAEDCARYDFAGGCLLAPADCGTYLGIC